jgi:hypothetical protein
VEQRAWRNRRNSRVAGVDRDCAAAATLVVAPERSAVLLLR